MGRKLSGAIIVNAIAGWASLAHAEVQGSLSLGTGASMETNPYNEVASSGSAVAVTTDVRPALRVRDENTTLDLNGLAQFRQFTRRYGLEDNYGVNLRMNSRPSERFTLRGTGSFAYNEGGFGRPGLPTVPDGGTGGEATPEVGLPDDLPLTDVTILGQRTRVKSTQAGLGFDFGLTDRSQFSADVNARAMRFKTAGLSNYNSLSVELRYSHALNDYTSVGVIGSLARTDYLAGRSGDARVASGLVTFDTRFASRWTLSLASGLSSARLKQALGLPNFHYTTISVRGQLCHDGEVSRLCLSANRSPQPTGNGTVRTSQTVLVDYSLRLSERDRFTLTGSYARTGRGRGATVAPATEFASATGRYEHQIAERLSVFASGSYAKIFTSAFSRRANLGLMGGLRFSIGALK